MSVGNREGYRRKASHNTRWTLRATWSRQKEVNQSRAAPLSFIGARVGFRSFVVQPGHLVWR